MSTLEKLKQSVARQEAIQQSENWKTYQAMLRRIVDDVDIKPKELTDTLAAVGRSLADIDKDVENVKGRNAIRKRMADAVAAKEKLVAAQRELEAIKTEKQKFVDEINPRIDSASASVTQLTAIVNMGSQGKIELRETCLDPGLQAEREAVDREIHSQVTREAELQRFHPSQRGTDFGHMLNEVQKPLAVLRARREEIDLLRENQ